MASFRFCETCLLHVKPFVVNKSAIFPFLGGYTFALITKTNKMPKEKEKRHMSKGTHTSIGTEWDYSFFFAFFRHGPIFDHVHNRAPDESYLHVPITLNFMSSSMEFWSTVIKPGKPQKVEIADGMTLRLTQVASFKSRPSC